MQLGFDKENAEKGEKQDLICRSIRTHTHTHRERERVGVMGILFTHSGYHRLPFLSAADSLSLCLSLSHAHNQSCNRRRRIDDDDDDDDDEEEDGQHSLSCVSVVCVSLSYQR